MFRGSSLLGVVLFIAFFGSIGAMKQSRDAILHISDACIKKSVSKNLDRYIALLPEASFSKMCWYMQRGSYADFEEEVRKGLVPAKHLLFLLAGSILSKDKKIFRILLNAGVRLECLKQKIIKKIPDGFID